jgi:hypothetical protein
VLALLLFLGWPAQTGAYAVLSHEAIIDSVWDTNMRPLLLKRFPDVTGAEIKEAHGYAYGGAIIQDMGYYPHGSKFFSDLTHYVRSGDFVLALLRDSKDLDGYAFALGALAHYAADNDGHLIGVNRAVPILYPKLKKKYGDVVTYEENPLAHVKTEFGFDVLQVAQGRYAPDSYHDFIGFGVSIPLLEQAFQETYGLDLKSVLSDEDKVLGSYRHDVSQLLPKATRIAWSLKKSDILKDQPSMTKKKFLYNLSRASYHRHFRRLVYFNAEIAVAPVGLINSNLSLFRLARTWRWDYFLDDSGHDDTWLLWSPCSIQILFRYSCRPRHARLRHFLLDTGACRFFSFIPTFLMWHASIMASRWKPCSLISHTCDTCSPVAFVNILAALDQSDRHFNGLAFFPTVSVRNSQFVIQIVGTGKRKLRLLRRLTASCLVHYRTNVLRWP